MVENDVTFILIILKSLFKIYANIVIQNILPFILFYFRSKLK